MTLLTKESSSQAPCKLEMPDRRPFIKGGGLALFAGLMASTTQAQEIDIDLSLSSEEQANIRAVAAFCQAWSSLDLNQVTSYMTDATIYRMSADIAPVYGHEGVKDQMQPWIDTSTAVEFKIFETFARGPIVINRRVDTFTSETRPVKWEGVGVFLLEEGKIREWTDYTMNIER